MGCVVERDMRKLGGGGGEITVEREDSVENDAEKIRGWKMMSWRIEDKKGDYEKDAGKKRGSAVMGLARAVREYNHVV